MQPRLNSEPTLEEFLSDCIKDATNNGGILNVRSTEGTPTQILLTYYGKDRETFIYRVITRNEAAAYDTALLKIITSFLHHPKLTIEYTNRNYLLTANRLSRKDLTKIFSLPEPITADEPFTLGQALDVARSAGLNDNCAQEKLLRYISQTARS